MSDSFTQRFHKAIIDGLLRDINNDNDSARVKHIIDLYKYMMIYHDYIRLNVEFHKLADVKANQLLEQTTNETLEKVLKRWLCCYHHPSSNWIEEKGYKTYLLRNRNVH